MLVSCVQCKQDVVFLLTQPPSPPEEPAPPSPSKDKDSSAIKKKPSKGKAAAGGQQVDCKPPSLCASRRPCCQLAAGCRRGRGFSEDLVGGTDVDLLGLILPIITNPTT